MHRLGCRRVLDKLNQIILIDHLTRRHGDVFAQHEGVGIGHLDAQLAVAVFHIVEQVFQATHQIFAAAVDGRPQDIGVGHGEVAGRHGIDELSGVELNLLGGLFVDTLDIADRRLHPPRGQQVGLFDVIK